MRNHLAAVVVSLLSSLATAPTSGAHDGGDMEDLRQATLLRRPVALICNEAGSKLFTANRDSGTVSVVDCDSLEVIDEIDVGGQPADILVVKDGKRDAIIVLDTANNQLLVLRRRGDVWTVSSRVAVADSPVRCIANQAGNRLYVASLWSRAISVFKIEDLRVSPIATTRLPFEPRELCLSSDGKHLVVASAFSGQVVAIGTENLKPGIFKSIPCHNIRGMAFNGADELLIACQKLNPIAHSTRDDVHWGNMISNLLLRVPLEKLHEASGSMDASCIAMQLGEPGNAAGDPGRIVVGPSGELAVLLSGVQEVAIGDLQHGMTHRAQVGKRPIAAIGQGGRLFVANQFSDSVTVIDWADSKSNSPVTVSLGQQPILTEAQFGEQLFYDSRMALDGWMSCHSCHTEGHTNGQRNDNLSDGSFGDAKQVLSLLGVGETGPWGWNGSVKTLKDQVVSSIENTMRGSSPTEAQADAIVAYLEQLPAPPRTADANQWAAQETDSNAAGLTDLRVHGQQLFRSLKCVRCHVPPTFTSAEVYDVGVSDAVGNVQFNPPSLRGVNFRRAFFHDGRASDLKDVFSRHQHQLAQPLQEEDHAALIAYLRSL